MSDLTLMNTEQAEQASFAELARNIRTNLEAAAQPGGRILDKGLLVELVEILDQKIGGRRPELPLAPPKPHDPDYDRLPTAKSNSASTASQEAIKKGNQSRTTRADEQR